MELTLQPTNLSFLLIPQSQFSSYLNYAILNQNENQQRQEYLVEKKQKEK
jgi:hypothetical protein